jgi:hypothetical protein
MLLRPVVPIVHIMGQTYGKGFLVVPMNVSDKFRKEQFHDSIQDLAVNIHYWNFRKVPPVLQRFSEIDSAFGYAKTVQDIFMPTGQKVKTAGYNIFSDHAEILKKCIDLPILGEQKGDVFIMVFIEIDLFQRIQFHFLKEFCS